MFTVMALYGRSASALSVVWMSLLVGSVLFAVSVTLGILFRSARWWRIAVILVIATLLLGATASLLDRLGYAR